VTHGKSAKLKLAVLISGSGRTLKNFIDLAGAGELPVDIRRVISSSATAGGLRHAKNAGIPSLVVLRECGTTGKEYSRQVFEPCRQAGVDYVCMAGFLKHVLISPDFENRVLNIHPALLPAFGGKGMYGDRVHEAVLESGAKFSGCTVHFADNKYDHGPIIYQQVVPVLDDDTPETLAARVFEAEKQAYPHVLRKLAKGASLISGRRVQL
jgi:phosphoribosylglycinamide formyltransferase-1